jgi:hypothetical protein
MKARIRKVNGKIRSGDQERTSTFAWGNEEAVRNLNASERVTYQGFRSLPPGHVWNTDFRFFRMCTGLLRKH